MKKILLATTLVLVSSAAFASGSDCDRRGNSNNYRCEVNGTTYNVSDADSAAAAAAAAQAYAAQKQSQAQTQGQGQTQGQNSFNSNDNSNRLSNDIDNEVDVDSRNTNSNANVNGNSNKNDNNSSAVNGGNSVNIEGDPAHTTSFNVGVGVGITARLGEGVRARSVTEAADWLASNGQECLALEAMLEIHPDLKKLGKEVNCK